MLPPDFFCMADTANNETVKPLKKTTFEYPSATSNTWVTIRPDLNNEGRDYKVLFYKPKEGAARYQTSIELEIKRLQQNSSVVEL